MTTIAEIIAFCEECADISISNDSTSIQFQTNKRNYTVAALLKMCIGESITIRDLCERLMANEAH